MSPATAWAPFDWAKPMLFNEERSTKARRGGVLALVLGRSRAGLRAFG